jgi:hypothetical protein
VIQYEEPNTMEEQEESEQCALTALNIDPF